MQIKKFKNGFGIQDLILEKDSTFSENSIIYSSNGTFKSSFSNAFSHLSLGNGHEVLDRLNPNHDSNKFECDIVIGNKRYDQTQKVPNIIVYSRELTDVENWTIGETVNQLIVSVEYKKELSKINKEFSSIRDYYVSVMKASKLETVSNKIESVVKFNENITLDQLIDNLQIILNSQILVAPDDFDISKIHQQAYAAIDEPDFLNASKAFVMLVKKEISGKFFDENFGIDSSLTLLGSIEKTKFLNDYRKITIYDKENEKYHEFSDFENFQIFINEEINNIVGKNPEIKKQKDALEKSLGGAVQAKVIKENLKDVNWIEFYANGRDNIVHSKLKEYTTDLDIKRHLEQLLQIKKSISLLEKKVVDEKTQFEEALIIHDKRFKPPFSITIENKSDTILKLSLPQFIFKPNRKIDCKKDYDETRSILSTGEKNAFDIINLIVKYENLSSKKDGIVILDDIVESFDYANRIAFIEYIKEMKDNGTKVIVLTHNFEFFRTLQKRLDKSFKKYSSFNDNGVVTIGDATDLHFSINEMFKISDRSNETQKNLSPEEYFIASLPFVREVSSFSKNDEDYHYLFHMKKVGLKSTVSEIISKIKENIPFYTINANAARLEKNHTLYYDFIMETSREMLKNEIKNFDLYRKIILAIACRIKAEELMIDGKFELITGITKNQTRVLFDSTSDQLTTKFSGLVERVILCTSEFIHLNAFLYEPLVDIDPKDLVNLFIELDDPELITHENRDKTNENLNGRV